MNASVAAAPFSAPLVPLDFLWPGWDGVAGILWEYDFFLEMFPPPFFRHVNASDRPAVIKCSDIQHVSGIHAASKAGHTKIIVHTSDEFKGNHNGCNGCVEAYNDVPLVFRQYAFHLPGNYPHLVQIPLGYMVGMLRTPNDAGIQYHTSTTMARYSLARPTTDRLYKWTFIGSFHGKGEQDRKTAIETFKGWEPHFQNNSLKHHEMVEVYNNTVFVLVGRGWVTLDCFRIYEALIGGAVPLVVGSKDEIGHLFHYNGADMPLLTADSWSSMLAICQSMTAAQIDEKRRQLVMWYVNKIDHIKGLIGTTFNITLPKARRI